MIFFQCFFFVFVAVDHFFTLMFYSSIEEKFFHALHIFCIFCCKEKNSHAMNLFSSCFNTFLSVSVCVSAQYLLLATVCCSFLLYASNFYIPTCLTCCLLNFARSYVNSSTSFCTSTKVFATFDIFLPRSFCLQIAPNCVVSPSLA